MSVEVTVTQADRDVAKAVWLDEGPFKMGIVDAFEKALARHRHESTAKLQADLAEALGVVREEVEKNKQASRDCPVSKIGGSAHERCPKCQATRQQSCGIITAAAFETVERLDTILAKHKESE